MRFWKAFLLALFMIVVAAVLGASLLIWRGLRATRTPSRLETVLAQTVRNRAIPGPECTAKNPFDSTSDIQRQGRELFPNQCAVCHGIDGSGRTQLVRIFIPGFDLRQPQTQDLADAELHFVIENGVQFTGMPAWGNPHRESSGNSWKLVLFLRSLRPLSTTELSRQGTSAASRRLCWFTGLPELPCGHL